MAHEIEYWDNGNKRWEAWKDEKGEFHRVDGSAYILYFENGNKKYEAHYINGKRHRKDGPARIWYYEIGNIEKRSRSWYLFGEEIDLKKIPIILDGKFFNFVPSDQQILDVSLNFNREYGLFLKKFKEENYGS